MAKKARTGRTIINITLTELRALALLRRSKGLFGSEIVHLSNGSIPRGSVYVLLKRLEEKGYVSEEIVEASADYNLDRRLYRVSSNGKRLLDSLAHEFGFSWNPAPN